MNEPKAAPSLSPAKWGDLAREVIASAIQNGVEPIGNSGFLMEQRRIREGLVAALTQDDTIAQTFAASLVTDMPKLSAENALDASRQLLLRRAGEQQEFHKALTEDTRFLFPEKLAETPIPERPKPTGKFVSMLAQENRKEGPESVTHIVFQALGQEEGHAALIKAWEPGGAVHQALTQKLHELLPDVRGEAVDFAAEYFMKLRHERAVEATHDMNQNSEVVKEAKRISHESDPAITLQLSEPAQPNFVERIYNGLASALTFAR